MWYVSVNSSCPISPANSTRVTCSHETTWTYSDPLLSAHNILPLRQRPALRASTSRHIFCENLEFWKFPDLRALIKSRKYPKKLATIVFVLTLKIKKGWQLFREILALTYPLEKLKFRISRLLLKLCMLVMTLNEWAIPSPHWTRPPNLAVWGLLVEDPSSLPIHHNVQHSLLHQYRTKPPRWAGSGIFRKFPQVKAARLVTFEAGETARAKRTRV